ncbi:chorismate mutase, partial [Bacillus cereus group sp. BceL175]
FAYNFETVKNTIATFFKKLRFTV